MPQRADLSLLQVILGHNFSDRLLLERAITHRSSLPKNSSRSADYERLEFIGDAVLDLCVGELLLDASPEADEGQLSKQRAALVNTLSLASLTKELEIVPYIRLSKSELASGATERSALLADIFEALIGALYKDGGLPVAKAFIGRVFATRVSDVKPYDPKTELQEVMHALGVNPPRYLLELAEGPQHAPVFVSVVEIDGKPCGRGRGNSKKASQQAAAAEALQALKSAQESGKK